MLNISLYSCSGTNFWAVEVAPGVLRPIPVCIGLGTCGVENDAIFCKVKGVTRYSTDTVDDDNDPVDTWTTLSKYTNSSDSTNACNCAQFFAKPPLIDGAILTARGCAVGPHPKTVMLNADMVQNFPISGAGGVKNLISSGAGVINNIGTGVFGELCAPFVVVSNPATFPAPGRLNSNNAVNNTQLTFPQRVLASLTTVSNQGFGCVTNSVGNPPSFIGVTNVQNAASTLLPKDSNNAAVSLWATVQLFMTGGIHGSCIGGISVYNNPLDGKRNPYTGLTQNAVPNYSIYSGSIAVPLNNNGFIGQNKLNGLTSNCVSATPSNGEGRDNFYREFEVAWVKMVTVGFSYSHIFKNVERVIKGVASKVTVPYTAPGNGKLGSLSDIILKNPRQIRANINSGTISISSDDKFTLPSGITWTNNFRTMTGGPIYGSSTCYLNELTC